LYGFGILSAPLPFFFLPLLARGVAVYKTRLEIGHSEEEVFFLSFPPFLLGGGESLPFFLS